MAGFSHSVEDGSSARSGTGRDGSSTDGGAAASVGTCCAGGVGGVGFGVGLK